jgi:small acid-soluble spore protein I (minor)
MTDEVKKMDIDIRKAILHNIQGNSRDQLEATITDAIQDGQEKMLPGLGFLFELIWKQADDQEKIEMIDALEQGVQNTAL